MPASLDTRATRAVVWPLAAAACAVGSIIALRGLDRTVGALDHTPGLLLDFDIYLDQARRLTAREPSLAPHWVYPPLSALLFLGFGRLSSPLARFTWGAIELLACVALALQCARRLVRLGPIGRHLAGVSLVVASLPVVHCLKWGQLSVLIVLGSLFGMLRSDLVGALSLAGCAALKFYPAVYTIADLVRLRRQHFLVSVLSFILLGLIAPVLVLGPSLSAAFIARAVVSAERVSGSATIANQSLSALLGKWFDHLPGAPGPALFAGPPAWVQLGGFVLSLVCAAITLARLWYRSRGGLDEADAVAVMLCATLVIEPAWVHYFAVVPIAQAILIARAPRRPRLLALFGLSFALDSGSLIACLIAPTLFGLVQYSGAVSVSALLCLIGLWLAPPGGSAQPIASRV